jgi:hypothetical protein
VYPPLGGDGGHCGITITITTTIIIITVIIVIIARL